MNLTALDIIESAFRTLGVKSTGDTITAAEAQDALQSLNMMIDTWSAERLMVSALTLENFPVVADTAAYTIGAGKTFNTAKPTEIEFAYLRDTGTADYPLDIISIDEWIKIYDRQLFSAIPTVLYYDRMATQQSTQYGTINLYPTPDKAYTLYIESLKTFTEFASLTDTVSFPPAYAKALKFNLAIELANEWGKQVPAETAMLAAKSLEIIKVVNAEPIVSSLDFSGAKRRFNIQTGY